MAHVPSVATTELELLTFRDALKAANTPSEEYDIEKWIYAPNFYSEYRYLLGTRGKNPLICIGINPSTAKPDALDNTLPCTGKIWRLSVISSPFPTIPPSGRPGELSLKSAPTFLTASGIWCGQAKNLAPAGTAPGPSPKRGIPIIPYTCARTKRSVPSM